MNPYESPLPVEGFAFAQDNRVKLLREVRQCMTSAAIAFYALGSFPLIAFITATAIVVVRAGPAFLSHSITAWTALIFVVIAGTSAVVGSMLLSKQMGGIWAAIFIVYLLLIATGWLILTTFVRGLFLFAILLFVVVLLHRLLRNAQKLSAQGIPLSANPKELTAYLVEEAAF